MAASFFDRWRNVFSTARQPAKPYSEQGAAGFRVSGGYVEVPERNPDLTGANRWHTAADLLTNISIIAASVRYGMNLISRPKWKAEPPSDTQEAKDLAEFVEEVINGIDTSWARIVRRTAMYRYHGFHLSEWVAKKRDDGRIGIQSIEVRPAHTITKWDVDEHGGILGVVQTSPQTGLEIYLPRSKLVYLVDDALTDRPDGLGWFRHLADPSQRLRRYLKLETMGFERDLSGIPVGRAPIQRINEMVTAGRLTQEQATSMIDGLTDFVTLQAKKSNTGLVLDSEPYRVRTDSGESLSNVMQWGLELITGDPSSVEALGAAINRLEHDMALIMGTESMLVGKSGEGSRALSEDKSRNLYLTSNATLSDMAEAFDRDIVTALWTMNGFPDELRPKLRTEDVAFKDAEMIARVLADMAAAGAVLHPNDPAINDLRDLLGIEHAEPFDDDVVDLMLGGGAKEEPGRPSRENPEDDTEAGKPKKKPGREDPPGGPRSGRGQAAKYDPAQPRDPRGTSTGGRWKAISGAKEGQSWVYRVVPADVPASAAFKPVGRDEDDSRSAGIYAFTDAKAAEDFRQLLGGKIVAAQIGAYEPELLDDFSIETYPAGDAPVATNSGDSDLYPKGQQVFIRDLSLIDQDTVTVARVRVGKVEKYDPAQPRDPAGSPTGGQWTAGVKWHTAGDEYLAAATDAYLAAPDKFKDQFGYTREQIESYIGNLDEGFATQSLAKDQTLWRGMVFVDGGLDKVVADGHIDFRKPVSFTTEVKTARGYADEEAYVIGEPELDAGVKGAVLRYDGKAGDPAIFADPISGDDLKEYIVPSGRFKITRVLDAGDDSPTWLFGHFEKTARKAFNPNQPREPGGTPVGGRWAGGGMAQRLLSMMAGMKDRFGDKIFNFERWLLEEGEEQDKLVTPAKDLMGPKKMCYMNAYRAILHGKVDSDEWFYTEGVVALEGLPITIEHAWLSNRDGEVMDVTIRDNEGASYYGVPFKFEAVTAQTVENKHYGLFSDGIRYLPVTQKPIGDDRAWKRTKKYSPDQPRDPKGTPTGGQWASGGVIYVKDKNGNEAPITEDSSLAEFLIRNPDGTYSLDPEREALHDQIVASYLAKASPVNGEPEMFMTGGGPASGKSAVLVGGGGISLPPSAVQIDPDAIKTQLPEFNEMFAAGNPAAGSYVHEESSLIRRRLEAEAIAGNYNVVLDTTGDSSVDKLGRNIESYRAAGYRIEAAYASNAVDQALGYSNARGQQTGRYVPESFLREAHANVSRTFQSAAVERNLFDDVKLYDTNGDTPRLVATGDRTSFTVQDEKLWADFVAKGETGDASVGGP